MIYSSVAVANSFLFLHFNEQPHIEMNISRLNMLTFLTQSFHSMVAGSKTKCLIDEMAIVGDFFPIYESLYRNFNSVDDITPIKTYGKIMDYNNQKEIVPFINSNDQDYCFIKDTHEQFFDIENERIEWLITKEGSPYDLAYKNNSLFIDSYFLILE